MRDLDKKPYSPDEARVADYELRYEPMTEDEREELIYSLFDEFKALHASITEEEKYAFMAGARMALVTVNDRLNGC
jgi:hypothetical protein